MAKKQSSVTFQSTLRGTVNGKDILVHGNGTADESTGQLFGEYDIEVIPEEMHPRILNACVITGHNAISRNLTGAVNPFRRGSHAYQRSVLFSDSRALFLHARCDRVGNHITSQFTLDGSVGTYELISTETLVETWVPCGPGHVHGNFTMSWVTTEGSRIYGQARTEYELPADRELNGVHHRFVTIQSKVEGNRFWQNQQVTLFKKFSDHSTVKASGFK